MATRKKPSSHKGEREFRKRQREVKKAEKAERKRQRRSEHGLDTGSPTAGEVAETFPAADEGQQRSQ